MPWYGILAVFIGGMAVGAAIMGAMISERSRK